MYPSNSETKSERKREEALKSTEDKYQKLFNSIDEGFCIIEVIFDANCKPVDYRFLEVNSVFEEQTGLHNAVGKTIRSMAPGHEEYWFRIYGEIALTGVSRRFEDEAKALNRYYDVYAFSLGKEKPYQVAVLFKDISERKKAEEALRQNEKRFQDLVETSLDFIYETDPLGNFTYVSPRIEDMWGIRVQDMIGKNFFEEIPANIKDKSQKDQIEQLKSFLGSPKPIKGIELFFDDSLGNLIITEVNSVPFFDKNGRLLGWRGTARDITGRKKAEETLKEAQTRLQEYAGDLEKQVDERSKQVAVERERFFNMLENLPVMVCLITADFKIPFANRLFREKFGESNGRYCYEYVGCVSAPCAVCESLIPLKTGKPHHWTAQFPSGTWVDAHDFPFTDVDGTKMILEADIDITERVNLQKQLHEKERLAAIGETAGMVGHDIRNPLQAIIGDVYLLKDYLSEIPEIPIKHDVVESLEEIERNVGYINKIVADLQDYSRALRLELRNVNLYELVIDVFRNIEIPENISPSIEVDSKINLKTDCHLLTRILTNLVINAVQAMPKGGGLSIIASNNEGRIVLSVGDTGVGIPDDIKSKLFTPMMTTKAKGQGLGLAVVKRLVEALNGTISFESQEGKGTKFVIELPA